MKKQAIKQQLAELCGTRKLVQLSRPFEGDSVHGLVVGLGRAWVLVRQFRDFDAEGFAAVRVRDIEKVRSGAHERCWERMFEAEGLLDEIATPDDVPLDDIAQLLKALQARGENVIVECEENASFYIGLILAVEATSVRFANFDALGRWDEAPHVLPLESITRVQFETPYVQTFSRHMEGPYGGATERSGPDSDGLTELPGADLPQFVGTGKKVRLTRKFPGDPIDNGFVLGLGREWLLLQQFHYFWPEGFTALRARDIIHIRSGMHEQCWKRIVVAEGVWDGGAFPDPLPLDDISQLLKALQARGENVIVQCEREDGEDDFYIGRILAVNAASLRFANFDPLGRWDEAPDTIPFRKITKIEMETPYLQIFSKHLEGPCPHGERRRTTLSTLGLRSPLAPPPQTPRARR